MSLLRIRSIYLRYLDIKDKRPSFNKMFFLNYVCLRKQYQNTSFLLEFWRFKREKENIFLTTFSSDHYDGLSMFIIYFES